MIGHAADRVRDTFAAPDDAAEIGVEFWTRGGFKPWLAVFRAENEMVVE